jgi:hypothetical protein
MTAAEKRYAEACAKDTKEPTLANLQAALDAARAVYRERHP